MEFTREIYWNVGQGESVLVPMYLLTLAAMAVMVIGFLKRIKVYKLGKPLMRTDNLSVRIVEMCKTVFLQTQVRRVRWPGTAHGLFFWGFFLLFLGTCLIFLQADFTDLLFDIKFLKGPFYLWFSLILDLAGLMCLLMLAGLLVRRYIIQPRELDSKVDDAVMHGRY
jgi:nitrate reductase gamma subunit